MRRRDFITLLGAAVAWPLAASAQESGRGRRLGMLMGGDEGDPVFKDRGAAFKETLAELGWIEGRNLRLDVR